MGHSQYVEEMEDESDSTHPSHKLLSTTLRSNEDKKYMDVETSKFEGLECLSSFSLSQEQSNELGGEDYLERPYFYQQDCDALKRELFPEHYRDKHDSGRDDTALGILHFRARLPNPNQVSVVKDFPKLQTIHEPHSEKRVYWFGNIKSTTTDLQFLLLYWTNLYFHSATTTFPLPLDQISYVLHDRFDQKKVLFLKKPSEDPSEENSVLVEFLEIDTKVEFLNYFSDAYWSITGSFPEICFVDDVVSFKSKKFDLNADRKNTEEVLYIDEKRDKIGIAGKPKIFTELLELGDSEILFTDTLQVEFLMVQIGKGGREVRNPILVSCDVVMTDKAIYVYPKEGKFFSRRVPYEDIEKVCVHKDTTQWDVVLKIPPDYDLFFSPAPETAEVFIKILTETIFVGMDVQDCEGDVRDACQYSLEEDEKFNSFKPILTELLKIKKTTATGDIVKHLRKVAKLDEGQSAELFSKKEGGLDAINNARNIIRNERKKQIDMELYNEALKNRDVRTLVLIFMKDYQKFIYREGKIANDNLDNSIPKEAFRLFNEACLLKKIRDSIFAFAHPDKVAIEKKEKVQENDIKKLLDEANSWGLTSQAEQLSLQLNEEIQKTKMINHIHDALESNNFEKLALALNSAALLKTFESDAVAYKTYQNAMSVFPVYKSIYDLNRHIDELRSCVKEPISKLCAQVTNIEQLDIGLKALVSGLMVKTAPLIENLKDHVQNLDKRIQDLKDLIIKIETAEKQKAAALDDLFDMFSDKKKTAKKSDSVLVVPKADILANTLVHPDVTRIKVSVSEELEKHANEMAGYFKQALSEWEAIQNNLKNQDEFEKIIEESIETCNEEEISRILALGFEPKNSDRKKKAMEVLELHRDFRILLFATALASKQMKNRSCAAKLLVRIQDKYKTLRPQMEKMCLNYNVDMGLMAEKIGSFKDEIGKIQKRVEVEERLFNALLTLDPLSIKNAMIAVTSNELYDSTLRGAITRAEKIISSNEAKINFLTENMNDAINNRDREKLSRLIKIAPRFKSLRPSVESAKRILFDDHSRVKEILEEFITCKDTDSIDEYLEENESFIPLEDLLEYRSLLRRLRRGKEYSISQLKMKLNSAISKRDKFLMSEAITVVEELITSPPEGSKIKRKNEIYALLDDAKKILATMNDTFIQELSQNLESILEDPEELLFTTDDTNNILDVLDNRKKKRHPLIERMEIGFKELPKTPDLERTQTVTRIVSRVFFDKIKVPYFWNILEGHPSETIQEYTAQFKQLYPQLHDPLTISFVFVYFCLTKGLLLNLLKEILSNDMRPFYDTDSCIRNVKNRDSLYATFGKFANHTFDATKGELWISHPVSRIKEHVKRIIEEFKIPKKERVGTWQSHIERIIFRDLCLELKAIMKFETRKDWHFWDMIEEVAASRRKTSLDFGGILLPKFMDETNSKVKQKDLKFSCLVGIALERKALSDILQSIWNPDTLKFYNKSALLFDSKVVKKSLAYLAVLSKVDFGPLNWKTQ